MKRKLKGKKESVPEKKENKKSKKEVVSLAYLDDKTFVFLCIITNHGFSI